MANNNRSGLQAQQFPSLQRNWHISVEPHKIVKCLQVKFVTLPTARLRQKIHDLGLADLIGDRLSRIGRKESCLGVSRFLLNCAPEWLS